MQRARSTLSLPIEPVRTDRSDLLTVHDSRDARRAVYLLQKEEHQRWKLGSLLIVLMILTWMIGLQMNNFTIKSGNLNQPFLMSYITGSSFVIYLVPEFFRKSSDNYIKLAKVAFQAAILYYFCNFFSSFALAFTSSTNQTILSTTSAFFVLAVGAVFKAESFTTYKVGALAVSMMGVALIGLSDSSENDSSSHPLLGDCLALCGAFLFACYMVLMKKKLGGLSPHHERLVFGMIGLFVLVGCWPVLILFDYIGVSSFEWPSGRIWLALVVAGLMNSLSDYISVLAMFLTSPFLVTISLCSGIPIGMVCDWLFYQAEMGGLGYYAGIAMIFGSLILTNKSGEKSTTREAVDHAIIEAIDVDETLSPLLSPFIGGYLSVDDDIDV